MSLLLVLSLAPVIALAIYIYIKDKFEKEPLALLLKCLLGGVGVAVSKWCTNTAQPSLETLRQIAKCLEVDVKDLLNSQNE